MCNLANLNAALRGGLMDLIEVHLKCVGGSSDFSLDDQTFAMKISSALRSELKDRNSRAKLVAGWDGCE
jgi:hypothetical protein